MLLMILMVIVSTILYRIPRGGLWGNHEIKSSIGAGIWSVISAIAIGWSMGVFWGYWIAMAVYLTIAERPGWSDWWPNNNGGNLWRLNLRGLLLLNPIMGNIYFLCYKHREKYSKHLGWTELAEMVSGFVTALGTFGFYLLMVKAFTYLWPMVLMIL